MTQNFNHPQDCKSTFVKPKLFMGSVREIGFSRKIVDLLAFSSAAFRRIEASIWARIDWKTNFPVPVLIEALKAEESEVRWHAAWVLSQIGDEAKIAVPALIEAMKDKQGEVRRRVAKTLRAMGSEVEIPASVLVEALEDKERYVRRFATRTLAKLTEQRKDNV
jgi:HEAT repeat protein